MDENKITEKGINENIERSAEGKNSIENTVASAEGLDTIENTAASVDDLNTAENTIVFSPKNDSAVKDNAIPTFDNLSVEKSDALHTTGNEASANGSTPTSEDNSSIKNTQDAERIGQINKESKLSKRPIRILLIAGFFVVCFLLGSLLGRLLGSLGLGGGETFILLLSFIPMYFVTIILHEGGHLIFGLLTGYGFSSFRIGSFMWIKQDGKIALRRYSLAGTGGQCLMSPPEVISDKPPVILYNLGGVIVNIISALLFVVLAFVINAHVLVSLILLVGAILSLIAALTNGIPFNVRGVSNDGMNALSLSKDKNVAISFINQLRINEASSRGMLSCDMPDHWFTLPDGADMNNLHCATVEVMRAERHLDRLDFVTAEREISALLKGQYNIIGLHRNLLICDLIVCRIMNGGDPKPYITAPLRTFIRSMKTDPGVILCEYLIALFVNDDMTAAESIRVRFEKIAKKYPYPQYSDLARRNMDMGLEKYKNERKN